MITKEQKLQIQFEIQKHYSKWLLAILTIMLASFTFVMSSKNANLSSDIRVFFTTVSVAALLFAIVAGVMTFWEKMKREKLLENFEFTLDEEGIRKLLKLPLEEKCPDAEVMF